MLSSDAISFYGGRRAVATALGISKSAVYQWADLVPELSAVKLDRLTGGRLRYDPASYARHKAPKRRAKPAKSRAA
jgi:hypothetical protein